MRLSLREGLIYASSTVNAGVGNSSDFNRFLWYGFRGDDGRPAPAHALPRGHALASFVTSFCKLTTFFSILKKHQNKTQTMWWRAFFFFFFLLLVLTAITHAHVIHCFECPNLCRMPLGFDPVCMRLCYAHCSK